MSDEQDDPRPSLVGLDERQQQRPAAEFFAALPWEPVRLDPKVLSAERFLELL